LNFHLNKQDTGQVSIISSAITGDKLIKVRLSQSTQPANIYDNLDKIFLMSPDSKTFNPITIKERGDKEQFTFHFYFDSLISGPYIFKIDNSIFSFSDSQIFIESAEFTIEIPEDKTAPKIESVSQKGKKLFPSENVIEIIFSEPCQFSNPESNAITIMKDDSSYHEIEAQWKDMFQLNYIIPELGWDESCVITLNEQLISDLSGNTIGDSTIQYKFTTYNRDSLGSVSGTVTIDSRHGGEGQPYLICTNVQGTEFINEPIYDDNFAFLLPPGKYLLKGFMDKNENGKLDFGSLAPFNYSETSVFHPDTIRVRTRFESAGVKFKFK
jgi:hypothetical protein